MIEAVNSAVVNASIVRSVVEGASVSRANIEQSAKLESVAEAPKAPYISPYISIDVNYDKAVLQVRDSDTGDILRQYPSESRLQQIRSQEEAQQQVRSAPVARESQPTADVTIEKAGSSRQSLPSSGESGAEVSVPSADVRAQAASAILASVSQSGTGKLSAGVSVAA